MNGLNFKIFPYHRGHIIARQGGQRCQHAHYYRGYENALRLTRKLKARIMPNDEHDVGAARRLLSEAEFKLLVVKHKPTGCKGYYNRRI